MTIPIFDAGLGQEAVSPNEIAMPASDSLPAQQGLFDDCLALFEQQAPVFEIRAPAFCSFRDMEHFEEPRVLGRP